MQRPDTEHVFRLHTYLWSVPWTFQKGILLDNLRCHSVSFIWCGMSLVKQDRPSRADTSSYSSLTLSSKRIYRVHNLAELSVHWMTHSLHFGHKLSHCM